MGKFLNFLRNILPSNKPLELVTEDNVEEVIEEANVVKTETKSKKSTNQIIEELKLK